MRVSRVVRRALIVLWLGAFLAAPAPVGADTPTVLVAQVEGAITPVTASHLAEGVERAQREGFDAFLVEIDTPGGLGTAMEDIFKAFLASEVPVIAYVSPPGAQAASAGAFITIAANVAAMAPGTSIGAATPVGGETGEAADEKVIQAFAAEARAIAEERGRNVDFAMEMVTEGRAEPASVAVEEDIVDLIAANRTELLEEIDGMATTVAGGRDVELRTAGAALVDHDMTFTQRVQQTLANPNIAFLFLSIGTLAIIYELANPGIGLGGIIGVILLLLAFFALAVLPVNVVGVLLLLLAAGLFIAEVFAPGTGIFAGGGVVSLLLAGIFLFRGEFGVDLIVILPTVIVVGLGVIMAGRLVWRARVRLTTTGEGTHVGREVEVHDVTGTNRGTALIDGTFWRVRSAGPPLREGMAARVVRTENLDLIIEPIEQDESPEPKQDHSPEPKEEERS